jgi:putative sterol carrier protein
VSTFLSDKWFADLNGRLAVAPPAPLSPGASTCQIVFDFQDSPPTLAQGITLTITGEGARLTPGDVPEADVVLRLAYHDGAALTSGQLDSATALRDGRIKVRGDVNVLIPLASWLNAAFTG